MRLTPEREANIRNYLAPICLPSDEYQAMTDLLAEIDALRAELVLTKFRLKKAQGRNNKLREDKRR